ncbi:hypothetical protein [Deinococcus rufus]|uniref:Uncharacterized protein n=1 Tax=Deinococcus rufus TaxID=2136097 RepID=A0ABV7ZAX7_9DEIO
MTDASVPTAVSPADAIKASEKLLDFMLKENDRILAETKTAEDRARGNVTIAAGGIPLLTFLKAQYDTPTALQGVLAIICVVCIIVVLGLVVPILRSRKTQRVEISFLEQRQRSTFQEETRYDEFLHEMQSILLGYIEKYGAVRDLRFRWLTWQTSVLGVMLGSFAVLVMTTFL